MTTQRFDLTEEQRIITCAALGRYIGRLRNTRRRLIRRHGADTDTVDVYLERERIALGAYDAHGGDRARLTPPRLR